MIACILIPRFALVVAATSRAALLRGPVALSPEPGQGEAIGDVSAAAEGFGVRAGMRLGEALARCPALALVAPDPAGVAEAWEEALCRLEGMGAAVEPGRPGVACFEAAGLRALHGGGVEGVLAAAQRALGQPARFGAAPTRFCALAAATVARPRRWEIVEGGEDAARRYLARRPVGLLALRDGLEALPPTLGRLGVRTLGELAALPRPAVGERFGPVGLLAHDLACGRDVPPVSRVPEERLEESLELPEAAAGPQLERALVLLIDRLLARRERRARTLRAAVLSATLVEGGTWRERVVFREPLADPERMRLALASRLGSLSAPAESLRLVAERLGPPAVDQCALLDDPSAARRGRLREGVRQARVAAGPDAALRILAMDPASRVPERRAVLAPFELS